MSAAAKRLGLETLGWVALVAGILALVLPGPGLLLTFAGLAILSTQYVWARRLMAPVRVRAWRGAAEGVRTAPRILLSALGGLALLALGALWLWQPPAPAWWPVPTDLWLFGGPGVGGTLLGSGVIALGLLVFAVRRFYRRPHAIEGVERMEEAYKHHAAARREARRRLHRMRRAGVPWRQPQT